VRTVRRAFLCGYDHYSQTDYEHRRQWLEDKLHFVASAFAIKLCAYAVMSNHYHVVLHVRIDLAEQWSQRDVVERWHSIFNGTLFSQMYLANEPLSKAQKHRLDQDIKKWRKRLCDISWFMKIVNESIAKRANSEDNCTGHFSATTPALLYLLHPCSRGNRDLKAKPCSMNEPSFLAWPTWTSTRFEPQWRLLLKTPITPV